LWKIQVEEILKEVNNMSSEPLKLFQMFNNEKSRTLCTYGELYISGLENVRKDLMDKFNDMRDSLNFDYKNLEFEEGSWITYNSQLNFTMMEDNFKNYFDADKIQKIKNYVMEESFTNKDLAKLKEDDLLNFSNMGMSLLDLTDGNINPGKAGGGMQNNLHNISMKKKTGHSAVENRNGIIGGLNVGRQKVEDDSILTDIIEQVNESNVDLLSTFNDGNGQDTVQSVKKKKKVRKFSSHSTNKN
jgi:hypothetical protein